MTPDPDARSELRDLVAGLRAHLEARSRSGLLGVPAAPTPRLSAPAVHLPIAPALPHDDYGPGRDGAAALAEVRAALGDCRRCGLCSCRNKIVFGTGNANAALVFVGEAPGADEDAQGEPFVGAAGQLLTKMIEAMGFARADVYICNVIKCRPPGNRNPQPDEVAACEPFLKKQLAAIRPRMIVALGKFAAHALTGDQTPITRLRGNFRAYEGIQVMPTYHPAYLLRDPSRKREAWADLQQVVAALKAMGIEPSRGR